MSHPVVHWHLLSERVPNAQKHDFAFVKSVRGGHPLRFKKWLVQLFGAWQIDIREYLEAQGVTHWHYPQGGGE